MHLSRYSIFSGPKSTSYLPSDTPEPASLYEASKLEGERWLVGLAADHRLMIRTPWVYSANGRDFVKNAPDLFEQPSTLDVIADRIGTPTWNARSGRGVLGIGSEWCLRGVHHWTRAWRVGMTWRWLWLSARVAGVGSDARFR